MDKREYFAGLAMQALIRNDKHSYNYDLARDAYAIADAMVRYEKEQEVINSTQYAGANDEL